MRRAIDIILASALLICYSPVMLTIALGLKLAGGPVFCGPPYRLNYCTQGRIGRWLRRLSADRFPELINVLLGDLSFRQVFTGRG